MTDYDRNAIEGFDSENCVLISGDRIRHEVDSKDRGLDQLEGEVIRLEFLMSGKVDLYTFMAGENLDE